MAFSIFCSKGRLLCNFARTLCLFLYFACCAQIIHGSDLSQANIYICESRPAEISLPKHVAGYSPEHIERYAKRSVKYFWQTTFFHNSDERIGKNERKSLKQSKKSNQKLLTKVAEPSTVLSRQSVVEKQRERQSVDHSKANERYAKFCASRSDSTSTSIYEKVHRRGFPIQNFNSFTRKLRFHSPR
jgi:hypothetical protein